ncbi:DUF1990 family protein [Leifsonia sp. F6_8S_P_1B]|uniref:DUF1990 family protein n=1 Tax=Leifsonia williamsii TaxID=3035919 RepID=A0ABT8KDH3_9MICO|nr:DUF1990 family protein [Leifsonia williamsii]MDN4615504.1 DUF1990 family protein [Leifsonia williamsii]
MPSAPVWGASDAAFRLSEVSAVIGRGDDCWRRAAHDVLRWRVKTRSGFQVDDQGPVQAGQHLLIRARVLGVTIVEPVEVVAVVEEHDRVGFSYRTLPGHPVDGEEAFIVHREEAGEVVLTVRSLTKRAPQQPWRALHPLLRVAQRVARRRYLRAL